MFYALMARNAQPHVVIAGAGFGGLAAARALAKAPVRITLVDRTNHHLFQPLLYQVAMAGLSPADIAAPIRAILRRQKNLTVLLSEATGIDLTRRTVLLSEGSIPYDYLVLATGGRTSYFGHDAWEKYAPGLKDLDDAVEIRRRVLLAFEAAEKESEPERRRQLLTFVVVGGGPTGVELAGAIAELARYVLASDFRHIDPRQTRIILVEAGPRILPMFPEDLAAKAVRQLERLGVSVRTRAKVTAIGIVTVRRQVPKILLLLPRCRDKRTPQVFSGDGSGGLRKWYDRSGKKRGKPFHVRSPISVYLSGDARTTV